VNIGTKNIKALAFACTFKVHYPHSCISDKPNFTKYAATIGCSVQTLKKYIAILKKKKLTKRYGLNTQLVGLNQIIKSLFDYDTLNEHHRFFTAIDSKKTSKRTFKEMEDIIFQTIVSECFKKQEYKINKKLSLFSSCQDRNKIRGISSIKKQAILNGGKMYSKVSKRNLALNEEIVFGSSYLSELSKYPKSTTKTRVNSLIKRGLLKREIIVEEFKGKFQLLEKSEDRYFYSSRDRTVKRIVGSILKECNLHTYSTSTSNPYVRFKNSEIGMEYRLNKLFSERIKETKN
jgi:DNA-binding MarR family transcriptional regulator